ncbi:MAG: cache domain-containing protein [Maritimibacter sp.]|uniref:cache domain-containing protein n=1 Tax=Maritimibacter sp. TaxID=2003363 RepID=UPI001DBEB7AB|nr:cache domain-containing protein [Maritimibacter sp.]MBL6427357.1 cache domain-containing protein [Maritimibacter sp.]
MGSHRSSHPRIFHALLGSAAVAFFLIAIGLAMPTKNRLETLEYQAQSKAALHAAASLQVSVSSLIAREWESLGSFGVLVDVKNPSSARQVSDAANRASKGILWAGVVGLDGVVVAGSDGLREGEDVSSRQWFLSGLHGVRIGNVYTPQNDKDGIGQRFNMSRPMLNDAGDVVGVAVYTMRFDWITNHIAASADAMEVEFGILDRRGDALADYAGFEDDPMVQELRRLALLGSSRTSHNVGSDSAFVGALMPNFVQGDVPEFGWSLIVRLPSMPEQSIMGTAWNSLVFILGGAFVIIAAVAYLFAAHFLRPISALVDTADNIARGVPTYPTEDDSSHEAIMLSGALARIQTTIASLEFKAKGT